MVGLGEKLGTPWNESGVGACFGVGQSGFGLGVVDADADADVVVPVVVVVDMLEARPSRVTSTGYTLVDPPRHIRYTTGQPRCSFRI